MATPADAQRKIASDAPAFTLTVAERASIVTLLKSAPPPWTCEIEDGKADWVNGLRYRSLQLSPSARTVLAEAGLGCARGGQGSNGAMWIIRLDTQSPIVLAGPQQQFDGFLYSIQVSKSKGYRDIIIGWHSGGGETALAYFKFDGARYQRISRATFHTDERGIAKISPEP